MITLEEIEHRLGQETEQIAGVMAVLAKIPEADDQYYELGEALDSLLDLSADVRLAIINCGRITED
jgi:hypothetical protein